MSDILKTDLYEVAMAAAHVINNTDIEEHGTVTVVSSNERLSKKAVCEAFVRKLPVNKNFVMVAGINDFLDAVGKLKFTEEQLEFLQSVPALQGVFSNPNVVNFFRHYCFGGTIEAVREGEIVYPGEPIVQVAGDLVDCTLVETLLLSHINYASLIATKAAAMVQAARGKPLYEFGTRRTHPEAALTAARAAYLAGFVATSNVEAGMRYGIPLVGTQSHMWVMAENKELESFVRFFRAFPDATLLVDTYEPLAGLKAAMEALRQSRKSNPKTTLAGIRIDSGDLRYLATESRKILDTFGFFDTKIIVSGDLDERFIGHLVENHAPIDAFGVGTKLVTPDDSNTLGGVYKLVQIDRKPVSKNSEGKVTPAGSRCLKRTYDLQTGRIKGDMLSSATLGELVRGFPDDNILLKPWSDHQEEWTLNQARDYARKNLARLPEAPLVPELSPKLKALTAQAAAERHQ